MFTSLLLVALQVGQGPGPAPAWNRDYYAARSQAQVLGKPLAVFIGSGQSGWAAVCKGGELDAEVRRLLADDYVCVYLDADQPEGRKLADAFEPPRLPLLVLSDRSCDYQAFRHSGAITNETLVRTLNEYGPAGAAALAAASTCRT